MGRSKLYLSHATPTFSAMWNLRRKGIFARRKLYVCLVGESISCIPTKDQFWSSPFAVPPAANQPFQPKVYYLRGLIRCTRNLLLNPTPAAVANSIRFGLCHQITLEPPHTGGTRPKGTPGSSRETKAGEKQGWVSRLGKPNSRSVRLFAN
jgi:hypothetical protein